MHRSRRLQARLQPAQGQAIRGRYQYLPPRPPDTAWLHETRAGNPLQGATVTAPIVPNNKLNCTHNSIAGAASDL
jgi:hypothetical protein